MDNRNRQSNYLGDEMMRRHGSPSGSDGRSSPGARGRVSLANVMAGNRASRQSPIGGGRGSASRAGSVYGQDPYAAPGSG